MASENPGLVCPGDVLMIERRHLVKGVMKNVTTRGTYKGVELVGTTEHIILEDARGKKVRLFPITAISEIRLVKAAPREESEAEATMADPAPRWDPSVA